MHFAEYPEDLADIPGQAPEPSAAEDLVPRDAVPLDEIVVRGVPEERVADRGVRRLRLGRVGDAEIDREHLIDDVPERVEPAVAVGVRGRVAGVEREPILTNDIHALPENGGAEGGGPPAEDAICKSPEL